jgi:hypothetical protein
MIDKSTSDANRYGSVIVTVDEYPGKFVVVCTAASAFDGRLCGYPGMY